MRYGRATALDAGGRSAGASLELDGSALVIRVPQEFVEAAALPLVIDPSVSGFSIAGGTTDDIQPDIAYSAALDRYEVVWEDVYSATDHDVLVEAFDGQGNALPNTLAFVDGTGVFWGRPRIAAYAASSTFMIVAAAGSPSGGARTIVARILSVPANTLGPVITVDGGEAGDKFDADVCGDWRPNATSDYCVVWERGYGPSDHDIHAQWLSPITGTKLFGSTVMVDNTGFTLDQHPSLPKTCGSSGTLAIVWEREAAAGDHDIFGARFGISGAVLDPSTPLYASVTDARFPSASAGLDGSDHWVLAYEAFVGGDWDIGVRLMSGVTPLATANLGELEYAAGSGTWNEDQRHVSAATDGSNFSFAYSETYQGSASDHDVYLATLGEVGGQLRLCEGHLAAGLTFTLEDLPRLCAQRDGGGAKGAFAVVWQDTGNPFSLGDVFGATFEDQPLAQFCMPGADAALCPCANPPSGWGRGCDNSAGTGGARLTSSGSPSIGTDTLHLTSFDERPSATSIFLSGTTLTEMPFGQGRRCIGGQLKRLYVKAASQGSATAPGLGDPSFHQRAAALGDPLVAGSVRYYLVYYRDPVLLGGCPSNSTFNSTPSGALTWRP